MAILRDLVRHSQQLSVPSIWPDVPDFANSSTDYFVEDFMEIICPCNWRPHAGYCNCNQCRNFCKRLSFTPATSFTLKMFAIFFVMAIVDGPLVKKLVGADFCYLNCWKKSIPYQPVSLLELSGNVWHIPLYAADGKGTPPIFAFLCSLFFDASPGFFEI